MVTRRQFPYRQFQVLVVRQGGSDSRDTWGGSDAPLKHAYIYMTFWDCLSSYICMFRGVSHFHPAWCCLVSQRESPQDRPPSIDHERFCFFSTYHRLGREFWSKRWRRLVAWAWWCGPRMWWLGRRRGGGRGAGPPPQRESLGTAAHSPPAGIPEAPPGDMDQQMKWYLHSNIWGAHFLT